MGKYYITTTLPYVNADPHIGFALEIIEADVLARFHALLGDEVIFNTGTDEHGIKIYRKAQDAGQDPQAYVDVYAKKVHLLKDALGLCYTHFIRTTDAHHKTAAQAFWMRCFENGDIYKKPYDIKYCVGCELEKTDSELVDGRCPLHPTYELELISEENYFFRFSKYQQALLDLYASHPDFVEPSFRLKEIKNFVEAGLVDFSVSRLKAKMPWGVSVPNDPDHVMYVWFDALINYISTLGWPEDQKTFGAFWPGEQICGKDNLRQQSAMWQAMLLSAKLPTSKRIYVHGFITANGQKMSKSIGNVINPLEVCQRFGTEVVRYFLLREIPFGEDGGFSETRLRERYASDLANTFGNLVNRTIAMSKRYFDGKVPPQGEEKRASWGGREGLPALAKEVAEAFALCRIDAALEKMWVDLYQANKYIEETRPFKKEHEAIRAPVLYSLLEACRWYAWMLSPVMPETSKKVWMQLGLDPAEELKKGWDKALVWGGLTSGAPLGNPEPLFPPLVE